MGHDPQESDPRGLDSTPSSKLRVPPARWTMGHITSDHSAPPPTAFQAPPGCSVLPRQIWTPVHYFMSGTRRTSWGSGQRLPPRMYVDSLSIIREVSDVTTLRRGDHCLITLNVLRCLSPALDHFVSMLGSWELFSLYHHFIVLDDVETIDEHGVPLTKDGKVASIAEYSNTIPEFYEELRLAALGKWYLLPIKAGSLLLRKARCHRAALADYGDMPHIFRFERHMEDADRERVVAAAEQLLVKHPRYNVFWSNCEHTTNMITQNRFDSPSAKFVAWCCCRFLLTSVGLVVLHTVVVGCYARYCLQYPFWALACYYGLTALPVCLQALVKFVRHLVAVRRSFLDSVITRDDLYHLLLKESCRCIIGSGLTVSVLVVAPHVVRISDGKYAMSISLLVVLASVFSDMLYCFIVQMISRLLLRLHGRFWLHGGSLLTRRQEEELASTLKKSL